MSSARRFLTAAAPLAAYTAAAVACTWPLAMEMSTNLGSSVGPGDPFLNLWILGWGMQAVWTDPASLLTGRVFDTNIFHPTAGTLAYSDHLLLQAATLAPLYGVTKDVVLCYNVLLLASLVLSALAMHVFVREVTSSRGGAYLAGLAWGFGSYRFAHLIHLQLQALYFLPLTFLFLHRVLAGGRRRDGVLLGVTTGLQAVASVYYGVIGALALVVGSVALLASTGRRLTRSTLASLALSVLVASLIAGPVALIYWRVQQSQGFGRGLDEAARHAVTAAAYVQVPPGNVLYGRTGLLRPRGGPQTTEPPSGGPEREQFPGFVLAALALVGVWSGRRREVRPVVVTMIAVAVCGCVLSLGPDGVRPVYAFLHRHVFGFQAIRAPARFGVLTLFGLATLAAVGWRALAVSVNTRMPRGRRAIAGLVIALAAAEWAYIPDALVAAPPRHTPVGEWLRHASGGGAVAVLPMAQGDDDTLAMLQSLEHGRPLLNGYSGQRPFYYAALVDALSTFPSDESLLALRDTNVQYVVARQPFVMDGPNASAVLIPRAKFQDATIYELVLTPELERRLAVASAITPPPAGAAPFAIGERARYALSWAGAGTDVAAGEITIAVEPPAYRFVVTATTAPWIARFFEARDEYITQVDAALLPLVHTREQRHGARHVMRAFVYDHGSGAVRTGPSAAEAAVTGAMTLPLAPDARDAIATLFYARTLLLDPTSRVMIPVNEAGRNLIVELGAVTYETISLHGRDEAALRVEPTIRQRVQRRVPPKVTVWLSRDDRRVPLAFDVAAGFGQVRGELIGYVRAAP